MNIQSVGKLMVLAKNERKGSNSQMYYNFAVLTDGQAGNISCTAEAYEKAVINTENEVVFAFNDQYKSFRVVDIIPAPYVPGDKADNLADKSGSKPDGKAVK